MKKLIFIATFALLAAFTPDNKVYICDNGKTVVYHVSTTCSALKQCKHEVVTMTKEEAIKQGKRACKVCS